MRGRKQNSDAEETIARLENLMAVAAWSQVDLSRKLRMSPSTVCRALAKRTASNLFLARAEALLSGNLRNFANSSERLREELHLLQEMYGLLKLINGRIEGLVAESPSNGEVKEKQQ